MRPVLIGAGLALCVALAGCEQPKQEAAAPAEPVAKKSLARQAQMYSDQDMIQSADSATLKLSDTPGMLDMTVEGKAASAGWTNAAFLPRIYAAAPKDGIYEVDVIATKPAAAAAEALTPITAKGSWRYPEGRLKGVKFMTKTNEVVAMLPETPAPAAK